MANPKDIGNLMHLYLDEIDPGKGTNTPQFLIQASAHLLNEKGRRNWVPLIVREVGGDRYEVIGNTFVYAVAEEAGLERVWCIIADDSDNTAEVTRVLAGEEIPKVNLSKASRDEIMAALEYVMEQPGSPLKTIKLAVATNRIDEAPRQFWKTLDPVVTLKCGITKGKKLDVLKQVFYLTPQLKSEPQPEPEPEDKLEGNLKATGDTISLQSMTAAKLKELAKKQKIYGYSKMKKDELIAALSQASQ
ncbi:MULTISPECIES: Rho termination factor N-terminal domain-containing protein [unclassified Leptolyngbya]|uniref:Rho termination factor N-terminal domain-containing protein n=1 Tax=unclassified Leptolyngbya TaxID=2650499 RepID=UPI001687B778|nr:MULTISPECIES: Rho termination factor N-terminal domain-containing protein [unclassified Leptolyngbya]MBD1910309.1 Rho termination factor N-terminal domain-containing protein [Leptolyngbya sp. FACHB-8]MBD2155779.1 Rho termination factor N-terminal domain-containing protein [Leptolyngbya sp. FACHB-16]